MVTGLSGRVLGVHLIFWTRQLIVIITMGKSTLVEVDVDIGSSTVTDGVLGLVLGVAPTLDGIGHQDAEVVVQERKVTKILMDKSNLELLHQRNDETRQWNIATLKAEKEDLEATLLNVQIENSSLGQRLSEAQHLSRIEVGNHWPEDKFAPFDILSF